MDFKTTVVKDNCIVSLSTEIDNKISFAILVKNEKYFTFIETDDLEKIYRSLYLGLNNNVVSITQMDNFLTVVFGDITLSVEAFAYESNREQAVQKVVEYYYNREIAMAYDVISPGSIVYENVHIKNLLLYEDKYINKHFYDTLATNLMEFKCLEHIGIYRHDIHMLIFNGLLITSVKKLTIVYSGIISEITLNFGSLPNIEIVEIKGAMVEENFDINFWMLFKNLSKIIVNNKKDEDRLKMVINNSYVIE